MSEKFASVRGVVIDFMECHEEAFVAWKVDEMGKVGENDEK